MKRTAWVLLGWLAACRSEPQEQPPLTQQELLNPESCKGCHPTHYNEWSGSMHAYASKDPVFLAMNKRGQEATNGELREFCVNCHAPMAVRQNAITDFAELDNLPEPLQGVTCYFCHNAQSVGVEHVNGNITLANDNIMRAALDRPVEPTAHGVQRSDNHDSHKSASSIMCGTCHDILTPAGVRLERTLDEYLTSIEARTNQSCQDCHMKNHEDEQPVANSTGRSGEIVRARKLHEHLWAAIDVPLTANFPNAQAMRAAIEACELPLRAQPNVTLALTAGPRAPFSVTIEVAVGHGMPSGATPDRRMWIEVIGYDDADKEVFRQGVIEAGEVEDPPGKRHPFMLRTYLTDEHGQETHMFWEAASISDGTKTLLAPAMTAAGGDHSQSRTFTPPVVKPLARIVVRWRVRPMGVDVLQDLVDSGHLSSEVSKQVPTLSVVDAEFRYRPDQGVYEMVGDNRDIDCSIYQCMLNPDAPQCRSR